MTGPRPGLRYLLVLVLLFVVEPLALLVAALPALLLLTALLTVNAAILGGATGWLSTDTSNHQLLEIAFLILLVMAFAAWLYVLFVHPRQTLAVYPGATASRDERLRLEEYVRSMPLINLGVTYAFLAVFFWFLLAQYLFGGSFFVGQPASVWNVIASGLNILSGDWVADYIKDTDVRYTFAAFDETKLRNKLVVTVTQAVVLLGLLTSVAGVIKLNDAAFGIKLEAEEEKEKDGS